MILEIMPENPKKERTPEEKPEEIPETAEKSSWGRDQQENSYYYDDDHGYEVYDPEKDKDEEEI